jgi:hypothetical protein
MNTDFVTSRLPNKILLKVFILLVMKITHKKHIPCKVWLRQVLKILQDILCLLVGEEKPTLASQDEGHLVQILVVLLLRVPKL